MVDYPAVPYKPIIDSWKLQPFLPPLKSEMDAGNVRLRARPGDKVRIITQAVVMTDAEYSTLYTFFTDTIYNGALRFNMSVWTGAAYETKVVQLTEPNVSRLGVDHCVVSMSLRVFP